MFVSYYVWEEEKLRVDILFMQLQVLGNIEGVKGLERVKDGFIDLVMFIENFFCEVLLC